MKNSHEWRARIESEPHGVPLGAGFLIDHETLITCAHVVQKKTRVQVSFPGVPDLQPIGSEVVIRGPWTSSDDRGDVAVLRLDRGVTIVPAQLTSAVALLPRRLDRAAGELHVYGFPKGFDREGADVRVQAPYPPQRGGEWLQLESMGSGGLSLQKGFSGAAVSIAESALVVGVVVAADKGESRIGKMLPLDRVPTYRPEFSTYLPLGSISAESGRRLHDILVGFDFVGTPGQLYQASRPDRLGPDRKTFNSVWEVVRFVADELIPETDRPTDQPLAQLLGELAARAPSSMKRAKLVQWAQQNLLVDIDRGRSEATVTEGLISIKVDASGDQKRHAVTVVSTAAGQAQTVYTGTLRTGEIRTAVEKVFPAAVESVPDSVPPQNLLVQFELPMSLLGKPVDEWHADRALRVPIGWTYPVTVRDRGLRNMAGRPQRNKARWESMSGRATVEFEQVSCSDRSDRREFIKRFERRQDVGALALSAGPRRPESSPVLWAALFCGYPVILWPRNRCRCECRDGSSSCDGDKFLKALVATMASIAPREIPRLARELRVSVPSDEVDQHRYGTSLTVFWREPRSADAELAPLHTAR